MTKNTTNLRVARQIRQLRTRSERERTGTFYVEGVRMVDQALRTGAVIELGVVAPQLIAGTAAEAVVQALQAAGIPIVELDPATFSSISFKENTQGIGAVVRSNIVQLGDQAADEHSVWIALNNVGNPGNLGAILRTCDAVGCAGAILLGETTDPYHPAALRASMGTVFTQRLVRATFDTFLRWKQAHGYAVVGTSPESTSDYRQIAYPSACVLLMGSERLGLSPEQLAACDVLARIPMVGTSDSLNLAVAASVMLYEVFYRRYYQ